MSWHGQAEQPMMPRAVGACVRCSRRSRAFTLDGGGAQGVDCSGVAAVDALGHLSTAVRHARLVGTAAWQCGPRPRQVRWCALGIDTSGFGE
eukprot:scaffold26811_cov31-Phaeocystis_antarctica.AAC.2